MVAEWWSMKPDLLYVTFRVDYSKRLDFVVKLGKIQKLLSKVALKNTRATSNERSNRLFVR